MNDGTRVVIILDITWGWLAVPARATLHVSTGRCHAADRDIRTTPAVRSFFTTVLTAVQPRAMVMPFTAEPAQVGPGK